MIRTFLAATATTLAALFLVQHAAIAAGPTFEEGQFYRKAAKTDIDAGSKHVKVEEFFWYGCIHCSEFDPLVQAWRKKLPADVDFSFVPNSLGRPIGVVHQQAFYIAQNLGVEDRIHRPMFDALLRDRKPLVTLPSIRDFFVQEAGIKPADFDGLTGSFMIDAAVRKADIAARDYGVLSTPTLVVGGEYLIDVSLPGFKGMKESESGAKELEVADFLIAKVRDERK